MHIPGPYVVDRRDPHLTRLVASGRTKFIAVYLHTVGEDLGPINDTFTLFAAAPDLLADLQSLVSMNNCNYDRQTDDYRAAMAKAQATLDKIGAKS